MISLSHLTHSIGTKRILNDVSLTIEEGQFVCLAGVSGSGKTTLLRLIAGLEHPDEGSITLGGRCVSDTSTHVPPQERGVGIVFQHPSLFPHLSVEENVMFGMHTAPRNEARSRARALLEQVHFSGREKDYPHMLSGGQHQRVALARALATSPAVMLLDEPFANLDSALRRTIREETRTLLKARGSTTIMVTHDPHEALMMADMVCLLGSDGSVLQTGHPRDLYIQPASRDVATFFGDVNLIEGNVESGLFHCILGRFPYPESERPNSSTLMLRPEAIEISRDHTGGVGATVARSVFTGDCHQVEVHIDDMALTVCDHKSGQYSLGEKVFLRIPEDGIHYI